MECRTINIVANTFIVYVFVTFAIFYSGKFHWNLFYINQPKPAQTLYETVETWENLENEYSKLARLTYIGYFLC